MSSLKQSIIAAVKRVSSDPKYSNIVFETPEAARDSFIVALIAELFPECPEMEDDPMEGLAAAMEKVAVVDVPLVPAKKAPKKASKKAVAPPPLPPSPPPEVVPEVVPEAPAAPAKKAPKKKAADAPAAEKKKPGPKPKADKGPQNVDNNPTFTKKFKAICEELKVEGDKKATLDAINKLTPEEFNAPGKKLEDHIRDILRPKDVVPMDTEEKGLVPIEFEGKEYYVDPDSKRVYVMDEDVARGVGYVGMAEFKEMVIPEIDDA